MRTRWGWILAILVATAAPAAASGADPTSHVMDSHELEIPFMKPVELPVIHLGGYTLPITKHTVMMWLAAALVVLAFALAKSGAGTVPRGLYNLLESIVSFIRDEVAVKSIGEHHAKPFVPYLLTMFFFILAMNLLGLVPYGATATANIAVTATLASMTFVAMVAGGVWAHGPLGFFKNLVPHGVPLLLWPLMLVLELVGLLIKPFALTMRLFANMIAGHLVILSFLGLISAFAGLYGAAGGFGVSPFAVAFALGVYMLELGVALLQAYIFTFLSALFIGMMVHSH